MSAPMFDLDPLDLTRDGLPLSVEEATDASRGTGGPNARFLGAHSPLGRVVWVEPTLYGASCRVVSQDGEERLTPLARLQSLGLALEAVGGAA